MCVSAWKRNKLFLIITTNRKKRTNSSENQRRLMTTIRPATTTSTEWKNNRTTQCLQAIGFFFVSFGFKSEKHKNSRNTHSRRSGRIANARINAINWQETNERGRERERKPTRGEKTNKQTKRDDDWKARIVLKTSGTSSGPRGRQWPTFVA